MKDGIRNQLEGLDVERKRLEVLMASDPAWIAYRQQTSEASITSITAAKAAEQELTNDVLESLHGSRLYIVWRNLLAASDSLRELLGPENNSQGGFASKDDAPENDGPANAKLQEPSPFDPLIEQEAFRTKLVLKSDTSTVFQPVETAGAPVPSEEPAMREMSVLLTRRAGVNNQLITQLAARSCSRAVDHCATGPETLTITAVPDEQGPTSEDNSEHQSSELTWISGVDADDEAVLHNAGLTSFSKIAAMTVEQVKSLRGVLPRPDRVSKQQWIEQAAMLAAGHTTAYVSQGCDVLNQCLVAQPASEPWQLQSLPLPVLPEPELEVELESIGPEPAKEAEHLIQSSSPNIEELVSLLALEAARRQTPTTPFEQQAEQTNEINEQAAPLHSTLEVAPIPEPSPEDDPLIVEHAPEADAVTERQSLDVAPEVEHPTPSNGQMPLSDRMERFERTMTEIALPDLRRPQPFERAVSPAVSESEVNVPPSLPPAPPARQEQPSESTSFANGLSAELPEFDWDTGLDEANWDEAAVEIVTVEPTAVAPSEVTPTEIKEASVFSEPVADNSHLNGHFVPVDPAEEALQGDPSPYDLARRMDSLARSGGDDDQFIRFDGEIEEASVQIIRSDVKSTPGATVDQMNGARSVDPPSDHVRTPDANNNSVQGGRSARRFLNALTGSKKTR